MAIRNILSILNSSDVPLGAGESFTGKAENTASFQEVDITISGTPDVAPGTFFFESSADGVFFDQVKTTILTGPRSAPSLTFRMVLPFYRIRYENGPTPLSAFKISSFLHSQNSSRLTRFLNDVINISEPVTVDRAVIDAELDVPGTFDHIQIGQRLMAQSVAVVLASDQVVSLPTGAATEAKQDVEIANLEALNSLVPAKYDYIDLSYTGGDLTGVVYRSGGPGGAVVSTLVLAYSGGNLVSVARV